LREDWPKRLLVGSGPVFTAVVRQRSDGSVRVAVHPIWVGVAVRDVEFVLLTLVIFGVLALIAKGAEKL
jgi:hypothetical protein